MNANKKFYWIAKTTIIWVYIQLVRNHICYLEEVVQALFLYKKVIMSIFFMKKRLFMITWQNVKLREVNDVRLCPEKDKSSYFEINHLRSINLYLLKNSSLKFLKNMHFVTKVWICWIVQNTFLFLILFIVFLVLHYFYHT